MTESTQLTALVDRSALVAKERQIHISEAIGEFDQWDVDLAAGTLTLTLPGGGTLVCDTEILGTAAPGPGSWLWSWANESFAGVGTDAASQLRAVGERDGVAEFTAPELPLGPAGIELPDAVWYRIAIAATILPGWHGYFPGTLSGGTKAVLVIRHPSFELPAPALPRVARTIGEALSDMRVTDHRAALASYAALREIPAEQVATGSSLTLPEGRLLVEFDDEGRIARVTGTSELGAGLNETVELASLEPAGPAEPAAAPAPETAPETEPRDRKAKRGRWFNRR